MLRAIALAMVSVAVVASTFSPPTGAAASPDVVASEPLRVVLLTARAHAAEVRMLSTDASEEWSAAARGNLAVAVQETIDQSPLFIPVALPDLSAEQVAAIDEFVAVANLASARFDGWTWFGGPTLRQGAVDLELGPSLAFLRERTGAHYAIGAFGYQQEQSKGVATTGAVATIGSGVVLGPLAALMPPVTFSYVTMFIADLHTGYITNAGRVPPHTARRLEDD